MKKKIEAKADMKVIAEKMIDDMLATDEAYISLTDRTGRWQAYNEAAAAQRAAAAALSPTEKVVLLKVFAERVRVSLVAANRLLAIRGRFEGSTVVEVRTDRSSPSVGEGPLYVPPSKLQFTVQ